MSPPQVFPLFVQRSFKIAERASVVESAFGKVTKTYVFCYSAEKPNKCTVFPKSSSSKNFEKSPFNKSCRGKVYIL